MKRLLAISLFCLAPIFLFAHSGGSIWQKVTGNVATTGTRNLTPEVFKTYSLNSTYLKAKLSTLSFDTAQATILDLPNPAGGYTSYKVWQTTIMEAGLAAKYPDIKTFSGYSLESQRITIKLDYTKYGFHAMVFDGANTYFIDPYSNKDDGFYICYYKRDYIRPVASAMSCEVRDEAGDLGQDAIHLTPTGLPNIKFKVHGTQQRTYRLALACTGEYAIAVDGPNPTKAGVLGKMVTSINRVNGVFERELAVTLQLIANNDDIIYLDGPNDPYLNTGSDLGTNQTNITNEIGSANYDIGHLFGTGLGGVADTASVCTSNKKARGITGQPNPVGDPFDIDYVVHEMGHQFGANHTFNSNSGSCGGNGEQMDAYEPGSGSTIMGYAGICGGGDNLQAHSDDYFHSRSLDVISWFITKGNGSTCGVATQVVNTPPVVPSFAQTYSIPYRTPFELTAPLAIDADHDSLTYCWEQWNLGDYQQSWNNTNQFGPIFRSFRPTASPTRVFPRIDSLVKNVTSYRGEKLPNDARNLKFRLTVRDMLNGVGIFNFPDDEVNLNVINTGSPFEVTHPNTNLNWTSGNSETVTWNVGGTDNGQIGCQKVDIFLSVDGGYTYPITLASNTPNDGSESITVPASAMTNQARVKIKGVGNVFFDISNSNFSLNDPSNVKEIAWQSAVKVFPIPSDDVLYISNDYKRKLTMNVVNALGQNIYRGEVVKRASIEVSNWAKGVYYIKFSELESGEAIVRTIMVN